MKARGDSYVGLVLLAAAVSTHVNLVDEVVRIPAGDWRYVEVALKQRAAFVSADYQVESGSEDVRIALLRRADLDRLRNDLPEGALAVTAAAASGRLQYRVPVRGVYVVLIDNRAGSRPAAAHLRVSLDFGARPQPEVTGLSPQRQFAVIAISFAVFFAIVTYSARRLLRGIRKAGSSEGQ